jgi:hypothetical protein
MVTVPACRRCNQEKAKNDHYLRDVLILDSLGSLSPVARILFDGKVKRAIRSNRSEVARVAVSQGSFQPNYTPAGIYLGHRYSFPLDGERIEQIFSWLVKGLYFRIRKRRLRDDCEFDIRRWSVQDFGGAWEQLQISGFNGPYALGEGVFRFIFMYAEEEPSCALFWLFFYDRICYYICTHPRGFSSSIPECIDH